ncbi:MAG: hypothetical protein AAFZ92_00415 [Pseudomonadota bacterium]
MQFITGIDPKAVQLTIILLRQYSPQLASHLPGPSEYPTPGLELNLRLPPELIPEIISELNRIGDIWLQEKSITPQNKSRDTHRQKCLRFNLDEWIKAGEQSQNYIKKQLH